MRIEIKIKDLFQLSKELDLLLTEPIDSSTKFDSRRTKKEVKLLLEVFNSERVALLEKYGKEEKKGSGNYEFPNEDDKLKFTKEIENLLDKNVELIFLIKKKSILSIPSESTNPYPTIYDIFIENNEDKKKEKKK